MARISWDQPGDRRYETGVDHGVLYPYGKPGVAWNGLISIDEVVSGGETEGYYFDGIKYYDNVSAQDFQATVRAFTYPDEFEAIQGNLELASGVRFGRQVQQTFGLAWRTKLGNDVDGPDHGYRLHVVYNATAVPSNRSNETLADTPTPVNFEWTINAAPVLPGAELLNQGRYGGPKDWVWPSGYNTPGWPKGPDGNTPVKGWRPTAYVYINSTDVDPRLMDVINNHIFGGPHIPPYQLTPFELLNLANGHYGSLGENFEPNYDFPWVDPDPVDNPGGGSTNGAALINAHPEMNWGGAYAWPAPSLAYPRLNGDAPNKYPSTSQLISALTDNSDTTYITIGYAIGRTPAWYYYPSPKTGFDIQQAEFLEGFPNYPQMYDPTKTEQFASSYRLDLAFAEPAPNAVPAALGIRVAMNSSGDIPIGGSPEVFKPNLALGDLTNQNSIDLTNAMFDGVFRDYVIPAKPPVTYETDSGYETYSASYDGFIGPYYLWTAPSDNYVYPEWTMEMKISKIWILNDAEYQEYLNS